MRYFHITKIRFENQSVLCIKQCRGEGQNNELHNRVFFFTLPQACSVLYVDNFEKNCSACGQHEIWYRE
jgi:hypothetical protein